jgi:hypothetical protein
MKRVRVLLIFGFFMACFSAKAQDTIFIKSSQPLLVRVLEISKNDVTYKNFYNPDGVIRKISNEQIIRIVYENGKTESLFELSQKTDANVTQPFYNQFISEDQHLSYNHQDITHAAAFKLMLKRDPKINSDELNAALLNAEGKKNGQIGFVITGPICFLGSVYLARRNYYGPSDKLKAKTFLLSGLSFFAVSEVTALIYKSLKNKQIRKAALLYNIE